jgi:CheY-like chemotaxis protein
MLFAFDPTTVPAGREAPPLEALLHDARILIADDDPDCRDLIVLALQDVEREIVVATNGGELLELIAEHGPFDLIITDIKMPWMEGVQVLAAVREAGLSTPVLVITGLTRPHLYDSIMHLKHARLLMKPFTVMQLREEIAALHVDESNA